MQRIKRDKGWAWIVLIGTFIAMFLESGVVKALGVLLPTLRQQLATDTWIIGLSIAMVPGFGALTCPIGGALSKLLSPRLTVMMFVLFATTGLFIASFASSVYMLLMSTILTGFSLGAEAIMTGELARYFDDFYDTANSISYIGLSLGVIIMPLLTQFLLDVYGWRATMMILGALTFHLIIGGAVLRPISVKDCRDDQQRSTDPNAERNPESSKTSIIAQFVYYTDSVLFKNINFVSILIYDFGNGYSLTGWLIYLVPHAIDAGFTPAAASALATYGGVGNLVANILYPIVKTKFGNRHVLYSMTVLCFVALLADPFFLMSRAYIGLSISSALFGFGRGMCILTVYAMTKDTVKQDQISNAFIWCFVSYSIGSIFSGFLSGWIFDETGSYTASFLVLSAVSLLCLSLQFILDIQNFVNDTVIYHKVLEKDPDDLTITK